MLGGSVPSLMEEKFHSRITLKPKRKHRGRTESELGCGNKNAIASTSIFESTNQPNEASVAGRDVAMEDVDRKTCQTSHQNVSKLARRENSQAREMASRQEHGGTLTRLGLEIDKKDILDDYSSRFGSFSAVVTKKQGERISLYQKHPPNNARLVCNHKMKPSLKKQYRVRDLTLNNVVVNLVRDHERYGLSSKDVSSIAMLSKTYSRMVPSVLELRELDSSPLLYPRLNYES